MKRPYVTEYFDTESAAGKKPYSKGYSTSLTNAKRNVAIHLIVGDCKLGVISNRMSGQRLDALRASNIRFTHYNDEQ